MGKNERVLDKLRKNLEPVGTCFYCDDTIYSHYGFVAIPHKSEPGFLVCFNCVDKAKETGRDLEFV